MPTRSFDRGRTSDSIHFPYRAEEHTSELQSQSKLVCRLLLEKKKPPSTDSSPAFPGQNHTLSLRIRLFRASASAELSPCSVRIAAGGLYRILYPFCTRIALCA